MRIAGIATVAAVAALAASPASALTLLQLSGSGPLSIEVAGALTLDAGDAVFDDTSLSALTSIEFDDDALAPTPDTIVIESGLDGFAGSFPEDLSVEILSWSGTLDVVADSILVIGGLGGSEPGDACKVDSGIVLSAGGLDVNADLCDGLLVGPPDDGVIVVGDGVLVPAGAIPEPGAAAVFAVGLLLVGARLRAAGRSPRR